MNIYTIIENIDRTLSQKRQLLSRLDPNDLVESVTMKFIEINLEELENIRGDLIKCQEKEIEASWIANPERMGR